VTYNENIYKIKGIEIKMSGGTPVSISGKADTVLTTKGDIVGYDTVRKRIGIGSNDQVLTADSTNGNGLAWKTAGGGVTLSSQHIELGADFTSSSASYVDVTNYNFTAVNNTGKFISVWITSIGMSNNQVTCSVKLVDNTTDQPPMAILGTTTGYNNSSYTYSLIGDNDGQVIKMQMHTDGSQVATFKATTAWNCLIEVLEIA
jgi:hypothetical protein